MRRNSTVLRNFQNAANRQKPQLEWKARTRRDHGVWRRKFRTRLRSLVGRMPERVPLQVRETERTDLGTVIRKKIYVRSEADYWIPAYYFVPKLNSGPSPALICLHGPSGSFPYIREGDAAQRKKGRDHDLDYAVYLAEHGYVTIAPIQRGWNETALEQDQARGTHSCYRVTMDAFLLGSTPVGLRCWDAARLIDFLETEDRVDARRIGVAGLSGGGTVGLFFSALEDRIKLAMIGGYYCTFKESIFSIHHCICNCVPEMLQWGEMREIAALIAPRPMLVISGTKDPIFPIAATRRAYRDLQTVYDRLGVSNALDKDFFDGPHAWSHRKTIPFLKEHWS